jgi:PKD repeat protein
MKIYLLSISTLLLSPSIFSQLGSVKSFQKISSTEGNFMESLSNNAQFGHVCNIGDLNADGITDFASGAPGENKVYILFMNEATKVDTYTIIDADSENFGFTLSAGDQFGSDVTSLGDLDNDGVHDIAIGASATDNQGAVYIVFLNIDGSVKSSSLIGTGQINCPTLNDGDEFGKVIANMGDFFGDGKSDIAISASKDDDGGTDRGAFYICNLVTNGSIDSTYKISSTSGFFNGTIDDGDEFGHVSNMGDFNNDGITDIAVGAVKDDDGGADYGAIWLLSMNANGTVQQEKKISRLEGNFTGFLNTDDNFGYDIAMPGDINFDGVNDLIVGAYNDDDGGLDIGAVWVLFLQANGNVELFKKINRLEGNFETDLDYNDSFGKYIDAIGDINGDGIGDIAVSADMDDDGGNNRGAFYIINIDYCPIPTAVFTYEINGIVGTFTAPEVEGADFYWYFDDGFYSYEDNPEHEFYTNGNHYVCLTTTDACGSNTYCTTIQTNGGTTGLGNENFPSKINYTIQGNQIVLENITKQGEVLIRDVSGKIIIQKQISPDNYAVNISKLSVGVYNLSFSGGNGYSTMVVVN